VHLSTATHLSMCQQDGSTSAMLSHAPLHPVIVAWLYRAPGASALTHACTLCCRFVDRVGELREARPPPPHQPPGRALFYNALPWYPLSAQAYLMKQQREQMQQQAQQQLDTDRQ
jgi:hypothetical protein